MYSGLCCLSHSDLLVQLGTIMENVLRQRDALVHRGSFNQDATFLDHHWSVFRAIREQDEEDGERAMQALLAHASWCSKTCLPQRTGRPRSHLVERKEGGAGRNPGARPTAI